MTEAALRKALHNHFHIYAPAILKIRTKAGQIEPFRLNDSQLMVHKVAQQQLRERGYVRIIVLKARQQGMSTYIEGRLFWQVTHRKGVRAFILTHHADATANLFAMAKRFYEKAPPPMVPELGASSAREMVFPKLDSGYKVGTAGTEGIGRSDTIQYFHGSEVAFWPGAEAHASGVLQAVPKGGGSEVWLESTANGMGGLFHEYCQEAMRGENDYEIVFLPWFMDKSYRMDPAQLRFQYEPSPEDRDYQGIYQLSDDQMAWRANKIKELRSEWLFRQEYPASAEEAFQVSGQDTLIQSADVMRARHFNIRDLDNSGALIIGVDPADTGEDRTALIRRKGRKVYGIETFAEMDLMGLAGHVALAIDKENPARVFIDRGGIGAGVVSRLREMGYGPKVTGVMFGESPMDKERYFNMRAEMWFKIKEWLEEGLCDLPDDNALHIDLCAPTVTPSSEKRWRLESKANMRKRGFKSPDIGDALALTFAYPVREVLHKRDRYKAKRAETSWMSA